MNVYRPSKTTRFLWASLLLLPAGLRTVSAQSVTFVPNALRYAGVGTGSGGYNTDTGVATATRLNAPAGLAFDGSGNLFIADRNNNCVRRVDTSASHVTTTIAGYAAPGANADTCNAAANVAPSPAQGLLAPLAVTADAIGDVFIADTGHNCVRELPAGDTGTARLLTVAGTCGVASAASTTPAPTSLALDGTGNLYILNRDTALGTYQVLRRSSTGTLCRVAGAASAQNVAQCADVTGASTLNGASGIALDNTGTLYIADTGNHCVRRLSASGLSPVLGTCGSGSSAIQRPASVAFGLSGAMSITLTDSNQVVRYNQNTGVLSLLAGTPGRTAGAYSGTQDGAASSAVPLNAPMALVSDANDNLYLADTGNNIVREFRSGNLFGSAPVNSTTSLQTLTFQINAASNLTVTPGQDYSLVPNTNTCNGPQTPAAAGSLAAFCSVGVTFTPSAPGNRNAPLLVRDSTSNTVVAAGLQGVGLGPLAELLPGVANQAANLTGTAVDVTTDSQGRYYVLVKSPAQQYFVSRYPANGGAPSVFLAPGAGLKTPTAMALDAAGNLYVADTTGSSTGGPSIQRYGADGSVNVDFVTGIASPADVSVDGFGNMLIAETGTRNDILKVYAAGGRVVLAGGGSATVKDGAMATSVSLGQPSGIVMSPSGAIYFADSKALQVYSVDGDGLLHVVAGTGTTTSTNGPTSASGGFAALGQALLQPTSLAVDAAGDVYIADTAGQRVYLFFPGSQADMNLTPILGTGTAGNSGDGGVSTSAAITQPGGLAVAPNGTVFAGSGTMVRSVTFPAQTLNFGTVAQGSTTVGLQPFVNTGNASLIRTQDPMLSSADFSYNGGASTCSSVVIAGQLCDFAFTFAPTTTGTKSGTATVTNNAPNAPQTINLTGTVVTPIFTTFFAPAETETYGGPYVGTLVTNTNGGTPPNGTLTFIVNGTTVCRFTGPVNANTTCTLPGGTLLPVRATPYQVVVTFTDGNYLNFASVTTLTVLPRTLTETVNNQIRGYLQPNPVLTGTPNGSLPGVGSDSFTLTYGFVGTPITASTAPGTYRDVITATATPNGNTVAANYNVVIVKGTFTITAAALSGFTAAPETEAYGGAYTAAFSYTPLAGGPQPTGTVTFRTGTKTLCSASVGAMTCSVAAGTGLQAGTYPVTVSYDGDANFAASTASTTLTVTPVPLTVTVPNQTKSFGAPVPNLTGTATVTGLVNGDTVGSTIILTYSTTVTASTPVGTYPNSIQVAVSGSSAASYVISNTPGSFTVGGQSTTTTLTSSALSAASGVPVTFTARVAASSTVPTGPIVFTADSQIIGTVTLDATGTAILTTAALPAGAHVIRASYAGNANFAASSASLTVTITTPVGSFKISAPEAQYIRGPGSRTFTMTISSVNGFAGAVSLACAGLPMDAKCDLSTTSVTLAAGQSQTFTLTTTTTLADATVSHAVRPRSESLPISVVFAFPLQLSGLSMLALGVRRRSSRRHLRLALLLALSFGLMGLAGCGSTAYYRIYPVTVTGTSVNGGPGPASATAYLAVGTP